MRKLIVLAFVSLDGVMQAPGGPEEDTDGGFAFGGWTVPYFDEALGATMGKQMAKPADLLLGRKTFEIFASYWPDHSADWPGVNDMNKYVASHTMRQHSWQNSVFLNGDVADQVRTLKQGPGPDLQVHGSATLIQTLLAHDLVDEFWIKVFPVVLGKGKRLFGEGAMPAALTVSNTTVTPSGVVVSTYTRAGEVITGSF